MCFFHLVAYCATVHDELEPAGSSSCRVIVHVDLDCFYAQVEMISNPELKDKPLGNSGLWYYFHCMIWFVIYSDLLSILMLAAVLWCFMDSNLYFTTGCKLHEPHLLNGKCERSSVINQINRKTTINFWSFSQCLKFYSHFISRITF